MEDDEVKRINELLNELEEIPSDGESIISDESDSDDFEFDPTHLPNDEISINSNNIFEALDINSLPIVFDDDFILNFENDETDNVIEISNKTIDAANYDMTDDEETLTARIHRDGLIWNNEFRHYERDDLFVEATGPTEDIIEKLLDPISAFQQIFPDTLIDHLVYQTNLYVMQTNGINTKPAFFNEMKQFLGINILMGIKKLPSYRDYWSSICEMRDRYISSKMPVNRFGWYLSKLHLNDNSLIKSRNEPGFDKLFKIRPILDILTVTFKSCYKPTRIQSIDESMIAFKGRSSIKQYMPNKPTKRGYKVWTRADAFGYVCQFEIYTGKTNNIVEKNLGARVVNDLVRDLVGKNYIVYFDNYFSSPKLMADLLEHGVLACGTTRQHRIDFPKNFSDDKKLLRGQYEWQATVTGIVAMKWKDNKGINFLSNFHDPTQESHVNRKQKDGSSQIIICPQLVKDYNAHMGYVDKADMLMTLYKIDRKSKRWYMRIFFHFLDLAVHNAFILFTVSSKNKGKTISLKDFRLAVATALIGNTKPSPRGVKKPLKFKNNYKPKVLYEKRFNAAEHMPIRSGSRRCAYCSSKSEPHRSKWSCSICEVALCLNETNNCFKEYHTK